MKGKKLLFGLFSLIIAIITSNSVLALEQENPETNDEDLTAYKETVKKEDKVGEYEVQISVPGKDGVEQHDEVILMVDGSYSMDNEWPQMKEAIIEIGKSFLNGTGNTQLTLMAFGMGDNPVLVHIKSVEELEKSLGELPGTLLYGRSSTNCEAGFTGVIEYIQNHDETLNDVHVVFISDGNINTDETPYDFYNWKENSWLKRTPEVIASMGLSVEMEAILYGKNPSSMFTTIFGEDVNIEELFETMTEEQAMLWADLVWEAVYKEAGFVPGTEYPVSDVERIFVDYDNKYGTHVQDAFYYALWGRSYPNRWARTPEAAKKLASMEEVIKLYLIDYDSYSSWMDTGISSDKAEFIQSAGIAGLIDALKNVITDLSKTSYNNAVVKDYTSKWVNPVDTNGDGIFDEKDITVIYNGEIQEDAKIEVINLTEITEEEMELLSKEDQEEITEILNNDPYLKNNSNGSVYRIKWSVKEGMLKASDRFILKYTVKVDTEENGYISNDPNYKANGEVTLTYDKTKSNTSGTETLTRPGVVVKEDPVAQEENVIIITKTDEEGNLLAGSDFEVNSNDDTKQEIVKEYSIDGINWTLTNPNYDAVYFRFKGLYDYTYTLNEIVTPKWYTGMESKTYDFTNKEGQIVEETIVNTAIKGEVIIHYVVKVGEEYIPFTEFAYDEEGNLLPIFENINLEDTVIIGKIEEIFEITYEDIESLTLKGLYIGNLMTDEEENKLEKDSFTGKISTGTQEFTYVYEQNVGTGEEYPLPPQTGYNNSNIIFYVLLAFLILIKKRLFN